MKSSSHSANDTSHDSHDVGALVPLLEALFFASSQPLSLKALSGLLAHPEPQLLDSALLLLQGLYSGSERGVHLVQVAGGWQLRTNPICQQVVLQLYQAKPSRLSRAALETLAVIAYRQPIVRAEVDHIRGVDSGGVLRTLQEHDLVAVFGRLDEAGRPMIYGTTPRFLEVFGLDSLTDLPPLERFSIDSLELLGEDLQQIAAEMDLDSLDFQTHTDSPAGPEPTESCAVTPSDGSS